MTNRNRMIKIVLLAAFVMMTDCLATSVILAQRGGGRGLSRGGNGGGISGGSRPSLGSVGGNGARPAGGKGSLNLPHGNSGRVPSLPSGNRIPSSRPSWGNASAAALPASRPNTANKGNNLAVTTPSKRPAHSNLPSLGNRPNFPIANANMGTNRPSLGGLGGATTRPNSTGNRPQVGKTPAMSTRPAPGTSATRPSLPSQGTRPNLQLPGSLNPATRPSLLPGSENALGGIATNMRPELGGNTNRPSLGGANRPSTLPGNIGSNLPATKPAPLPGAGGNRPGSGGNNAVNTLPGNISNRPGIGGGNGGVTTRPGNISNRPGIGGGIGGVTTLPGNINNRPGIGGNGNWGNGNWGNGNNVFVNNNNNNYYNNVSLNRPAWDRPGYGWSNGNNWHSNWHNYAINSHYDGWYNGCWSGYWNSSWYAPLAWGAAGWGLGTFTAGYSGNYSYYNPYYIPVTTSVITADLTAPYNYSQPVVINNYVDNSGTGDGSTPADSSVASTGSSSPPAASPTAAQQEAIASFDQGLEAFRSGDFQKALGLFDDAVSKTPGDPVIHEVRALTLFALGKYNEAAAALNSLLASAPGMDWTTVSSLYADTDTYTGQLRNLETYCSEHPIDAPSHFVLAYQYLVIGSKDDAVQSLEIVVANQPKDVTAARMLDALKPKPVPDAPKAASTEGQGSDQTAAVAQPATPQEAQPETDLVGEWLAKKDNSTIELSITAESRFKWLGKDEDKVSAKLEGDLQTTAEAIVFDAASQGSLGGSVVSKGIDQWLLIPPGAKEEKDGILFNRLKK